MQCTISVNSRALENLSSFITLSPLFSNRAINTLFFGESFLCNVEISGQSAPPAPPVASCSCCKLQTTGKQNYVHKLCIINVCVFCVRLRVCLCVALQTTLHPVLIPQNRFCVVSLDPDTLPSVATTLLDVLFYSGSRSAEQCLCHPTRWQCITEPELRSALTKIWNILFLFYSGRIIYLLSR